MEFTAEEKKQLTAVIKKYLASNNIASLSPGGDRFQRVMNEAHEVAKGVAEDIGCHWRPIKYSLFDLVMEVYHQHFENRF